MQAAVTDYKAYKDKHKHTDWDKRILIKDQRGRLMTINASE